MKKQQNKITFSVKKELLGGVLPQPKKANKFLPDYFKKLPPQLTSNPQSGTVKRCVPFLEATSAGYIIPLWTDVFVRATNGDLNFEFPSNAPLDSSLSSHEQQQIPDHPYSQRPYGNMPLKWHNPWTISTSEGVSCLITSPLNHLETRFKILDGVVDTDKYYNPVNFPFIWIGGEGDFYIPKGTPIAQVIPFRRVEFDFSVSELDQDRQTSVANKLGTVLRDGYKKMFHYKFRDNTED